MELPRSTPAEQGIDPRGIGGFLDAVADKGIELHSLMLLRHGHVVAEGWSAPFGPDRVRLLYSLSKSFASTAIGLAVAEGRLSIDDTVVSFFPDAVPAEPSTHLLAMRVHHLLCMGTGHAEDTTRQVFTQTDRDPVETFFSIPPDQAPGTVFAYNSTATYMLSAILTKVTGESLTSYLRPRLFDPLGIDQAFWHAVGQVDQGFAGLHVTTESVARFGQLYLQRGRWGDQQLVPEEWVATATDRHIDTVTPWRQNEPLDWQQGYGYQFWRCRHDAYRGDGAYGQFCVVLPDSDLVLVATSGTTDMQAVLDAAWDNVLPALDTAGANGAAQEALVKRLASLQLPALQSAHEGPDSASFSSAIPEAERADYPEMQAIAVARDAEGWTVRIDGGPAFSCGDGRWIEGAVNVDGRSVPYAGSAGWTGPDAFAADVLFLDTTHRLRIRAEGATFGLSWNLPPLSGTGFSRLAAPRP